VIEAMLNNLSSSRVRALKSHPVSNIGLAGNDKVVVTCVNGTTFECRFAVVTVSLGYLKAHHETLFTPRLPDKKRKAIEAFSFGTIARVKLGFEKPFWDSEDPGIHILWTEDRDHPLADTWVRHVVGFDEILDQPNYLMAWVSGDAAR
jgi:spermine oxidase